MGVGGALATVPEMDAPDLGLGQPNAASKWAMSPQRYPCGVLVAALKSEAMQGEPILEDIRKTLKEVWIDVGFNPYPENDSLYADLLERLRHHPKLPVDIKGDIPGIQAAWFRDGEALQKGTLFPNVRRMEDLFVSITPYEGFEKEELKRYSPDVSTYFSASLPSQGHLGTCSVQMHPEALMGLLGRLVVPDSNLFFKAVEQADGSAAIWVQYNKIVGDRFLALLEPGSLREAMQKHGGVTFKEATFDGNQPEVDGDAPARTTRNTSSAYVKIGADVQGVLSRSTIEGNVLKLPEQLERKLYQETDKVLRLLGGKWNRSKGGHVFQDDPGTVIEAALEDGAVRDDVKHFQFFRTPEKHADQIVSHAQIDPETPQKILEPSAGDGAIVSAIMRQLPLTETGKLRLHEVIACEINPEHAKALRAFPIDLVGADFLHYEPGPVFDRILANPPFTKGQDIQHANHMLDCLKPGGILVTELSAGIKYRTDSRTTAFMKRLGRECSFNRVIDVEPGTFKESGTMVSTVLLVAQKKAEGEV